MIDQFRVALARHAAVQNWVVGVIVDSVFARGMFIEHEQERVHFRVRVSTIARGFWGLPFEEARAIVEGLKEHNVLLRAPESGYFLSSARLPALLSRFSQSERDRAYKIGEDHVRRERHFNSVADLWPMLVAALTSPRKTRAGQN